MTTSRLRHRAIALCSWAMILAQGCATTERRAPTMTASFVVPETDGLLIEWRACSEDTPCIDGEWAGERYSLGFRGSPAVMAGRLGARALQLALDEESVYRLGDHAIEMTFRDDATRTILAVTWNELEQSLLDARLVVAD